MSKEPGVIIVGAGQAGARCASVLRSRGYAGTITLLGEEPHLPYERPPLSKEALAAAPHEMAANVPPMFTAEHFVENHIDLRTGVAVEALNLADKTVQLRGGATLPYATLVLATGSRPRPYTAPNVDTGTLFTLRSIDDARRLRAKLQPGRRLLLIGGGFIGLEIAATASALGCAVTVIEAQDRILKRSLSATAAHTISALHAQRGVIIKTNSEVVELKSHGSGVDYMLGDGTREHADLGVIGIGGIPNAELGIEAGLTQHSRTGGLWVDANCRTSAPGVYAIGDVACEFNPHYGVAVRLESWDNAEDQATRAAAHIVNPAAVTHDDVPAANAVPWFWTDQYDVNLQIIGIIQGADRCIERAATTDKRILFHLRGSRLLGAELFNSGRERRTVRHLVALGELPNADLLADATVPLNQVLAKAKEAATVTANEI